MLNYPLSVFIDTNIFIATKFDFSDKGTLDLLKRHSQEEKIKIYISNIVHKEVEKHIKQNVFQVHANFLETQKKAYKMISVNVARLVGFPHLLPMPDKEEWTKLAISMFNNFLEEVPILELDNKNIDLDSVLDDYFSCNPPFEEKENKKCEFPDALIIAKLKAQFSAENPLYVITADEGFCKSLEQIEGFHLYTSMKKFLDMLNKPSILYNQVQNYLEAEETQTKLCDAIKEKIESEEIYVDGMDCDRKGYCEGFDYDEIYLQSILNLNFRLDSIDDISDETIIVTLACEADITVDCSYNDFENAVWDSEDKEYLYLLERNVIEKHHPEFYCETVFKFKAYDESGTTEFILESLRFVLELDQYTRINREFLKTEDCLDI